MVHPCSSHFRSFLHHILRIFTGYIPTSLIPFYLIGKLLAPYRLPQGPQETWLPQPHYSIHHRSPPESVDRPSHRHHRRAHLITILFCLVQNAGKTQPLVKVYKKLWKDPPCFMGKFNIFMAIFNSFLYVYQVEMLETDRSRPSAPLLSPVGLHPELRPRPGDPTGHGGPLLGKQLDHQQMVSIKPGNLAIMMVEFYDNQI